MNERHEVITFLQRVMIADLLIAPVALVLWVEENGDGEGKGGILADRVAFLECGVARRVVDDQNVNFVGIQ